MSTQRARGKTVLVVDPNPMQQEQYIACLQSIFRVLCAGSATEAARMIVLHRPDIIVTELDLPDEDGRMLIRQIRQDPTTRRTIIACVTTHRENSDKVTTFQAGADDYIVKPIKPDSFIYRLVLLVRLSGLSPTSP